jgi:pre-rRNA-processing protein RIX1
MTLQRSLLPDSRLRAVTQRLAVTPNKDLPHVVPFLANHLASCKAILSVSEQSNDGAESGVLVHKLKTQLSTLLHEKTVEARWSATVLIKATIESGGWAILQGCGSWTQRLLTNLIVSRTSHSTNHNIKEDVTLYECKSADSDLQKPDPPAAKRVYIITLTKIFLLTQGHQSLLREITTPSMPAFVTASLNTISFPRSSQDPRRLNLGSPLLDTVLQALIRLIVHHPASFRPFVSQIKTLIVRILIPVSPTLPDQDNDLLPYCASKQTSILAQQMYTLLPHCAPKNSSNEEWTKSIREVLIHIHRTASFVFRATIEDWTPPAWLPAAATTAPKSDNDLVESGFDTSLGLPGWKGIEAGCERLIGLLQLLESHIATQSPATYNLPVGSIWSALARLLSVTVPVDTGSRSSSYHARNNPEITREERGGLWIGLPGIHIAAIAVVSTLGVRLQASAMSLAQSMIELALWVFKHEKEDPDVRTSVYTLCAQNLHLVGPSISRDTVKSLLPLINTLCNDLIPTSSLSASLSDTSSLPAMKATGKAVSANADAFLQRKDLKIRTDSSRSQVQEAASALFPLLFSKIPTVYIPATTRANMDRTAILLKHEKAMLASVLNPYETSKGKQGSSILPFLARESGKSLEVEGLLRPRMPGLQQTLNTPEAAFAPEDEDIQTQIETDHSELPMNGGLFLADSQTTFEQLTQIPTTKNQNTPTKLNIYRGYAHAEPSTRASEQDAQEQYVLSPGSDTAAEPSKRGRETEEQENMGDVYQMELDSPSDKRPRITDDTMSGVTAEKQTTNPTRIGGQRPSSAHAPTMTYNRNAGGDSDSDSDGSFEIPPIHLPSESEEDDEYDEEVDEERA